MTRANVGGHTDALVLEASEVWWPSLGELSEYPVHDSSSFFGAVAAHAVPHPTTLATSSAPTSVALSRLGRSIFLSARWCPSSAAPHDASTDLPGAAVRVWNPFSSRWLCLPVASRPASPANIAEMVGQGRVRLCPRAVPFTAHAPLPTARPPATESCREQQLAALTVRHATVITDSCLDALRRAASGHVSAPVHGALIEGGPGTGKAALLDRVLQMTPETYTVDGAPGRASCTYVVTRRTLDCADVLAMDVREAVKIVETVLRPPPLARSRPCQAPSAGAEPDGVVRPAVLLALRHVELLWELTNTVTSAVIYRLCTSLDALCAAAEDDEDTAVAEEENREAGASRWASPVVILSTAADTSRVPLSLLRHLVKVRVSLGATTLAERVACLNCLFSCAESGVGVAPRPTPQSLERVAETLASSTVAALMKLTAEDVCQRSAALEADTAQQRVGLVAHGKGPYSHLFGVQDVVSALEQLLVWPLTHLAVMKRLRIPCAKGAILYGASGSGKTAVMRALAERLRRGADTHWTATVQLVDGLTLVEKEVGRSEKNIAAMFRAARATAPTVLLLDNLEALAPPRGQQSNETTTSSDRTLSTLLTEMDGVAGDGGAAVFVVACAPSPALLDPAVRRPGRLDLHLHLTHPTEEIVLEALTAQLMLVVRQLCGPRDVVAPEVLHDALCTSLRRTARIRSLSRSAQTMRTEKAGSAETSETTFSAAQVSAWAREVTLKLIRAVVGEAEEPPADGVALEEVLQSLEACLADE